jgi:sigma-E factor negative regulatory protein RseB
MLVSRARRSLRELFAGLLVSGALYVDCASAADDPRVWLERMNQAMEQSNYEGTVVHMLGGETDVLNIVHRVENGRATERISSANAERELIRDDGAVTWFYPGQQQPPVDSVSEGRPGSGLLRTRLRRAANVKSDYYNIAFAGSERVAGRDARILTIRPKDGYRYGYRLWLCRASAMPLKTQLIASDGALIEQILFTQIAQPESIPGEAVKPSRPAATASAIRPSAAPKPALKSFVDWEAARVPPGFEMTVPQARPSPAHADGLRHVVYSDGLATVSLFVEPAVAAAEQAEGLSQVGATHIYTTTVDGHMVTAVGEAPAETVEMLARSARPLEAPDRQ